MRFRLRALVAASIMTACLAVAPARAETLPGQQIESFTLENGMEVVVITNHRIPAVSHMVWYRIGAADDPAGKSGLAHFHEHIMFLGAGKLKPREYAATVARHGGQENAFTGYDATSYFINIEKSQLPLAMDLESQRMRDLTASDEDVLKEKQVIIEERRMRVENNPDALLSEQINAALFRNHPYHTPVIGWMHEMEGLTKEDVIKFHHTWYHPNNAILVISGDITAAEVKPLAQKYYGGLAKAPLPARHWNQEPPQNTERRLTLYHKNVKQPSWYRSYVASSAAYGKKEEALPLFVLAEVLGEGKTSRLYQTLVVEQKLATGVDVQYNGFTLGPSQFEISAVPADNVDTAVLEKAIDAELSRVVKDGFSETEFTRAKNLLKAETIYARDSLTSMARIMGWIRIAGLDKDYFTQWGKKIDAVTPQQVNEAAKVTLLPNQSVTALLLPEKKDDKAGLAPAPVAEPKTNAKGK